MFLPAEPEVTENLISCGSDFKVIEYVMNSLIQTLALFSGVFFIFSFAGLKISAGKKDSERVSTVLPKYAPYNTCSWKLRR